MLTSHRDDFIINDNLRRNHDYLLACGGCGGSLGMWRCQCDASTWLPLRWRCWRTGLTQVIVTEWIVGDHFD